jgi:hypothetical protein
MPELEHRTMLQGVTSNTALADSAFYADPVAASDAPLALLVLVQPAAAVVAAVCLLLTMT